MHTFMDMCVCEMRIYIYIYACEQYIYMYIYYLHVYIWNIYTFKDIYINLYKQRVGSWLSERNIWGLTHRREIVQTRKKVFIDCNNNNRVIYRNKSHTDNNNKDTTKINKIIKALLFSLAKDYSAGVLGPEIHGVLHRRQEAGGLEKTHNDDSKSTQTTQTQTNDIYYIY